MSRIPTIIRTIVVAICLCAAAVITSSAAAQHTLRVDIQNGAATPSGLNPGEETDWSNAYKYLQDALSRAIALGPLNSNPIEIRVAKTSSTLLYRPDQSAANQAGTNVDSATFTLRQYVEIYGGYPGANAGNPDARDPDANITRLTGELTSVNADHVVTATNSAITINDTVLDGFRIDGGDATGTGGGGGIYLNAASPRIQRCHIEFCVATGTSDSGGGIYGLNSADPAIIDCVIIGNESSFGGGAGFVNGDPQFINCAFVLNEASSSGLGGGIAMPAGTLHLMNCIFAGNTADHGGGIWSKDCFATIVNCTFKDNDAEGTGGGLYHDSAGSTASTVQNCIFWANIAATGTNGHEIYLNNGELHILYSCINGGEGDIVGGGDLTYDTSNIEDDPEYDTGLLLDCGSPCIDAGLNNSLVLADAFNVDDDSNLTEKTPDYGRKHRIVVVIDMGAHEKQMTSPCSTPQYADIAPMPCTDGLVNIEDLLMVVMSWGSCPAVGEFCAGDIVVNVYNQVDIDDLLAVINNWSGHCIAGSYNAGSLSSVEDCMELCSERHEPYSSSWDICVSDCVEALCEAEIIDCD